MTTRVLPPDEWHRLVGTEAEAVWPLVDASTTQVLVVEQDGAIVGSWLAMRVLHVECLWIAPEHRKAGSVGRRLLAGMTRLLRDLGAKAAMTCAMTDDVRRLIEHRGGTKVPADCYVLPFSE